MEDSIIELNDHDSVGLNDQQDSIELNDPFDIFEIWYSDASKTEDMADSMVLSTVGLDGSPNSRVVLLKKFSREDGFVFYTNIQSNKGKELEKNPHACLLFWWLKCARQVKIRGKAILLSQEEADAYFKTRPREAQIAAWASEQSKTLKSYEELVDRFKKFSKEFEGREVPRPPHWLGFRVIPCEFEFLIYTKERLHKRVLFRKKENEKEGGDRWEKIYLSP